MTSATPPAEPARRPSVDGAYYLRAHGQERLARLVAHHSGARFEAAERGLVGELAGGGAGRAAGQASGPAAG